jgi:hypothetical protein
MTASPEPLRPDYGYISSAAAELLAKLIVLVAALLPVAGVAIRMIAFLLDPALRNVLQLAVALPIVDLTAFAAWALFFPVLSLAVTAYSARAIAIDQGRLDRLSKEGAASAPSMSVLESRSIS